MGVYTFPIIDETSPVAPSRLFKALCLDNHNILPKVVPYAIKSVDFVEDDSTCVGCVKQINFAEGSPFKYVKGKINELDVDKHYVKYTNFEGDVLGDLDCIVYEAEIEPSGSGSHYKMKGHFHTKGNEILTEAHALVKAGIESMFNAYKAVEEHLHKNPEVCA